MIACLLPAAHLPVHIRRDQTVSNRWAEQQMVDTQAGVPRPRVSKVVPESVDAFTWMKRPHRIGLALRE
jgi:predicted XRE-type DNA-binding protein